MDELRKDWKKDAMVGCRFAGCRYGGPGVVGWKLGFVEGGREGSLAGGHSRWRRWGGCVRGRRVFG
jgi:hypothetical protein